MPKPSSIRLPDELLVRVDRLAAALAQVVNAADLRQTLIQRGFARAREFPWERGIHALLTVYQQ